MGHGAKSKKIEVRGQRSDDRGQRKEFRIEDLAYYFIKSLGFASLGHLKLKKILRGDKNLV